MIDHTAITTIVNVFENIYILNRQDQHAGPLIKFDHFRVHIGYDEIAFSAEFLYF